MYKESWGEKRICPMCSKQYYDLGRSELECPECGKEIEVTTMSRPRRGRKPGSTNAAPLVNPIPPKPKEKNNELDIDNLDIDNNEDNLEDDTVLLEDETDIDPAADAGIRPPEDGEEISREDYEQIVKEKLDEVRTSRGGNHIHRIQ